MKERFSVNAPSSHCLIPEETARVAHAAFPRGNPYIAHRYLSFLTIVRSVEIVSLSTLESDTKW